MFLSYLWNITVFETAIEKFGTLPSLVFGRQCLRQTFISLLVKPKMIGKTIVFVNNIHIPTVYPILRWIVGRDPAWIQCIVPQSIQQLLLLLKLLLILVTILLIVLQQEMDGK